MSTKQRVREIDYEEEDEVLISPHILDPAGDEQVIIDVELKHVLAFLGGFALAGCVIALVWEWANHRFRSRRVTDIATAAASGGMALAQIIRESRLMMANVEFVNEGDSDVKEV